MKPLLFGAISCTTIFFSAACIHEREKETLWQKLRKQAGNTLRDIITDDNLVWSDIYKEKKKMLREYQNQVLRDLQQRLEQYNALPVQLKRSLLATAETAFYMPESEKTMAALISINVAVFACWKVPALQKYMVRYFCHNPAAAASNTGRQQPQWTLFTSCFSHRNVIHLTVNMVGLWSLGPVLHDLLGREQFVALYLSLGIGANVISHQLQLLAKQVAARPILPSMGASGALYGLLTGTAYLYPDAVAFVALLPWIPFKITYAVPALLTLDAAGILMRWRMFDHFAHLGGAALGIAYMQFGPNHMWPYMINTVRNLKKSVGNGKGGGSSNNNGGGDKTSGALMEMPERIRAKIFGKKTVAVPEKQ
ncbi:hypothetical protein MUCCIDRAFT_167930 [Mucor lusitanicus CBS 277.49]|uniref:Peptidase S54 rhomboid domain-containing protein n=2 Tax=Mucor circinelloides f. lusitanicus TaxID=29924 RepID=A0A162Q2D6_MUCCL|nr:hypothetical protein MUCCIDRAFT_167930 [Mucor lusitanicus CBS 277.49]